MRTSGKSLERQSRMDVFEIQIQNASM